MVLLAKSPNLAEIKGYKYVILNKDCLFQKIVS